MNREESISKKIFDAGSNPKSDADGGVLQNSYSTPLLKKQLNHNYEKLHRSILLKFLPQIRSYCTGEQLFSQ